MMAAVRGQDSPRGENPDAARAVGLAVVMTEVGLKLEVVAWALLQMMRPRLGAASHVAPTPR